MNFTKAILESIPLPVKGQRLVFHDTKVEGLQCRISSKGTITFSHFRRVRGGSPERVTLGKLTSITVDQARTMAKELNYAVDTRQNPAELIRSKKTEMTFGELFSTYLEKHSKLKKRTWKVDKRNYDLYLAAPLGKKRLSQITKAMIAQIHIDITCQPKKSVRKKGDGIVSLKSGSTANRILALVSSCFNWAIGNGICETNPTKQIKKNKERSRKRFLQHEELPAFFNAVQAEENPIIRDFILIALFTGARRSTVLSMEWKDISFIQNEWRMPRQKNDEPQIIPLGDEAMEILKQ